MKKAILLITFFCSCYPLFSQTLFTYGPNAVSKEEFLRAYAKNKLTNDSKANAVKEYLNLYTRFKLKVAAAKSEKLDTLQALQYDLQTFKDQIQDNYINDKQEIDRLAGEAFDRSQKDIHVFHFYAALKAGMNAKDSMDANKTIEALYNELKNNHSSYEEITKTIAGKYAAVKATDMGYITVFTVPYEYENIIYALKPGQLSAPHISKTGWHIFKVLEERKSIGKWKVAQILLALPPNPQDNDIRIVQKKADSLYNLLKAGADFRELAKENSNDRLTFLNTGEIPEFGCGKYDAAFENEVIKLQKNGDFSKPFITSHGIHIVKRLEQTPTPADINADAGYAYAFNQQVSHDARINVAKEKSAKIILAKIGFERNAAVKDELLFAAADSVSIKRKYEWITKSPISNAVIFSFAKTNIKGSDWLNFVKEYKNNYQVYKGEGNPELLKKYIQITGTEYFKKHLEEYSPAFKYQIQEFKEGNILFEAMERKVWGKAANDSAGLLNYYSSHKNNYVWDASADVVIFNCTTLEAAKTTVAALKNGADWRRFSDDDNSSGIEADSGRYELSQLPLDKSMRFAEGFISEPLVNTKDSTASFIKIIKTYPANQQRSFAEARGLIINDYQNELEEKWVAALKKKYPVKINEAVLASILKQ